MRQCQLWALAITGLVLSAACKSTASQTLAANTVGAQQAARIMAPSVWRSVPMKNLRYVLEPGKPVNPIFKNLGGILYCRGACGDGRMGLSTGVVAMTVAGGLEVGNSIAFPVEYNGNYAYADTGDERKADLKPVTSTNSAYRLDFTNENSATLKAGYMAFADDHFDTDRFSEKFLAFMEFKGPNHWRRITPGKNDYDLLTIIDSSGNETEYYQQFLADIETSGLDHVLVPVRADSDFGKGGPVPTGRERDSQRQTDAVDDGHVRADARDAADDRPQTPDAAKDSPMKPADRPKGK